VLVVPSELSLWLLAILPAVGHVLYGIPNRSNDGRIRVSLHNGDDFAPTDEPPRPDRVVNVRAIGANDALNLSVNGDRPEGVLIDAPVWASMIVAETKPAFIELAAEKFTSYLKHAGLEDVMAMRSLDNVSAAGREVYSKHIKVALEPTERGAALITPSQLPVEFVSDLALGVRTSRMTATLLVNGAPGAGHQVRVTRRAMGDEAASDVWVGSTDSGGTVTVDLTATGYWRLHAVVMTPHDGDEADWRSYWACLTFEV
jgi:hypothetical protein